MEHVARRLIQEMVLHPLRAEHDYIVRHGVHFGEEDKLVRETQAPGTNSRNIWDDSVEKTGRPERGRELHQPADLALPEEGTS